jgi:FHS family L-fucose permease-like MFS transporter
MVNYFKQQGVPNSSEASSLISLYWFGALVGRLLGAWLVSKIPSGRLLGIFGFAATAMVVTSMVSSGHIAIWALIACGFFNSIMFPNIFTLGIVGLGPLTSKGSSILIAAILGGAVIPKLQGIVADHIGLHRSFFIPAICYIYLAAFAVAAIKRPVARNSILPVEPV